MATFAPRQGEPGSTTTYNDFLGAVVLVADEQGVIPITSTQEERIADLLNLPAAKPRSDSKAKKESD